MADIRRVPFTEIVERVMVDLVRDRTGSEDKYKGRVNDVYLYDIPSQIDWRHLRKTGEITTTDDWSAGYITDAAGTTETGDSDCLWTSANSNNMVLKVNGYDEVYRATYSSSTELTIDRSWIGDAISGDEVSYLLFQDRYALASDFDRMTLSPDKSVYYYQSGNRVYLEYKEPEEFESLQVSQVGDPNYYTIKWISGDPYLFISQGTDDSRTLYYSYIPSLAKMTEYTTGTITTLANGGTAVTGSGTDFDGYVTDTSTYDYYFRIDGDGTGSASHWHKVASVSSDTALVLSDAYTGTSISTGTSTFTICTISLLPPGLDSALMYGAAAISAIDQGNKMQTEGWSSLFTKTVSQYRAVEGKKGYGKARMKTIYEKPGVRR